MQAVVADRDLALQGLFFPHDEVDDVIFQFSLATELLEPLGLSQRRGYLIALHDQQEVGLFFFGQVREEIRRGNELERSRVHRVQQRRDQLNRSKGEVDYLIDDYDSLSAVPIEVKSGKDYTVHSALNTFVKNDDYHVKKAYVLSNAREITTNGKITYLPIYDVMFLENVPTQQEMN